MDLRAATRFSKTLVDAGFLSIGGFHPEPADCVPAGPAGSPSRTLLLIGSAGDDFWEHFSRSPEFSDGEIDPLDRYTARTLGDLAEAFGMRCVFPFSGPPFLPFVKWGLRAGGLSVSPMGLLAHARYGPWIAFRAAFLSHERFGSFQQLRTIGPCESCLEKPCVAACPVNALSPDHYELPVCRAHVSTSGEVPCRSGCIARRACPLGVGYDHGPEQGHFHMTSFLEFLR